MLAFSHQEHIESYYSVTRNQHFELPPLNQKNLLTCALSVQAVSVYPRH